MKNFKKLLVAATALFMMASCGDGDSTENLGKEVRLTKAQAQEKIETAAESMKECAGLKITEKSTDGLDEIIKMEVTENGVTKTTNRKTSFSVSTESNIELLNKTLGIEALMESNVKLSTKYEGYEDVSSVYDMSFDGMVGLYVKGAKAYAQINATGESFGEEFALNEKCSVSLLDIKNALEDFVGEGDEDLYPPMDDETLMMIQTFLPEIEKKLPDPKAYQKDKDLTIIYSITMNDVNNAIDAVIASYRDLEPSLDLDEIASEIKEELAACISINELSLAITIHDDKFISAVSTNFDIMLKDVIESTISSGEADINGDNMSTINETHISYSYGISSHSKFEISALNSDYKINFPADMNNWPEIEF